MVVAPQPCGCRSETQAYQWWRATFHEGILCVGRDSPGSDPLGVIAVKGVVNIITRSNHWQHVWLPTNCRHASCIVVHCRALDATDVAPTAFQIK